MRRFEADRYYRSSDEAMRLIATEGTLSQWRHRGVGPRFTKFGNRILYYGADLNSWLDEHLIETTDQAA